MVKSMLVVSNFCHARTTTTSSLAVVGKGEFPVHKGMSKATSASAIDTRLILRM